MIPIHFAQVGVPINTLEELHELCLTYSALDIPFADNFTEDTADAIRDDLTGWFIQCTDGTIETKLVEDSFKVTEEFFEDALQAFFLFPDSSNDDEDSSKLRLEYVKALLNK